MDADKWLRLPNDLLVDILRRLDATAVIRCAGACRLWRRTIVDKVSCLRPRPGRFFPDLLVGFLDKHLRWGQCLPWQLQYVPAPNTAVPAFFTPATSRVSVVVGGKLYGDLLSSRDGFLLLGEESERDSSLCMCTARTGICRVLPAAPIDNNCAGSVRCKYVLATGYDVDADDNGGDGDDDETAVWILAVMWLPDSCKDGLIYQIFSSTSGAWGPVIKCSAKFPAGVARAYTGPSTSSTRGGGVIVCDGGVVSWFLHLLPDYQVVNRSIRTCVFSVDLRTQRAWITELPDPSFTTAEEEGSLVLAVLEDNRRVSLVRLLPFLRTMEVWELVGDGEWTLRRTIDDVQKVIPNCPSMRHMRLSGFCPRSGCLFGIGRDDQDLQHHFVIGVDGSSPRLIGRVEPSSSSITRFPYEMLWSAYISSCISKMKYF